MFTVLLIIKNPHELVALRTLFLKVNAKLVTCSAVYSSYLKALQYDPDIVIMEMPGEQRKEYLSFLKVIRNNRAIGDKPFLLYGNECEDKFRGELKELGLGIYLTRPLNGKAIIEVIRRILTSKTKRKNVADKNQTSDDELKSLRDPNVSTADKIALMRRHINKMLAFPTTVANILRVSQSDRGGAGDLASIIKTDPSVSTEILKAANSVHFSRGGKRILDIKDAIVRIGFTETKNIAMSVSVFQMMNDRNYETGFSHVNYWFHSLGVALIAEKLARNCQLLQPEEAFIGGLLHDIGILVMNEFFNSLFLEILDISTAEGNPFLFCEKKILGFDHNDLVKELLTDWNFPESFATAATLFGKPEALDRAMLKQYPMATVVSVADIVAKSLQIGRDADCCVSSINEELLHALRLPYGLQRNFIDSIYNSINMFNQILKIDKRTFPQSNDLIENADKVSLLCYTFTNEQFNPVFEYLKTQRYNLVTVSSLDDIRERAKEFNALIFTEINKDSLEQLSQLNDLKVLAFTMNCSDIEKESPVENLLPVKMMLFDSGKEIDLDVLKSDYVISRYPVDLRNVDMVLAYLLTNQKMSLKLNEMGAFKPQKKISIDGQAVVSKKVIIAHTNSEVRKKVKDIWGNYPEVGIEEASSGDIAFNLARTMKEELLCAVIDLNIPVLSALKIVTQIMTLPSQKKAKFVIMFSNATREDLVPFVKLGVRVFLPESCSCDNIKKKLVELEVINSSEECEAQG